MAWRSQASTRWLKIASVASLVGLVAACAPATSTSGGAAGSAQVIKYRVATIDGVGTPMNDGFERLVDEVRTCSQGRLDGTNFPAGQLGGFTDLIDGNRKGTYEITSGGFDVEDKTSPTLAALSLGFIFKDEAHVEATIDKLLPDMDAELRKSTGVAVVAMGEDGWRWTFSTHPINTLADLKGLKIRVPESQIPLSLWSSLGAAPTPVPFTEMYNALETGVIQGGESSIAQIDSNAFWEPAKNLNNTHHWFNIKPVRVNAAWYDSLAPDLQKCLKESAVEVFADVRKNSREKEAATLEKLQAKGVTVKMQPDDLPEWEKIAADVNEKYFAQYPEAKALIDKVEALGKQQ